MELNHLNIPYILSKAYITMAEEMHRQNQWQAHGDALKFPILSIAVEFSSLIPVATSAFAGSGNVGAETFLSGSASPFPGNGSAVLGSGVLGGAASLVSELMGKFLACGVAFGLC